MDASFFPIETSRTVLRPLSARDVSERYLSWLDDPATSKWILAAAATKRLSDLEAYVTEKMRRNDVLFLGIFDKQSGVHIGNIKYEPILPQLQASVIGVLIGDPSYRGKGLFGEVFLPTASWLQQHRNITRIYLGVDENNAMAIRTYEKIGFSRTKVRSDEREVLGNVSMVYLLTSPTGGVSAL